MLTTEAGEEVFDPPTVYEPAKWAAFFRDVPHEVTPITKGFRVALTYNLLAAERRPVTAPAAPSADAMKAAHWILSQFRVFREKSFKCGLFLKHDYDRASLNLEFLKGLLSALP